MGKKMGENQGKATTDLAMQLLRGGKVLECIACAERVLSGDPDDVLAYTILGAAYVKNNEKGKAIGAFQQALSLDMSARAYFNLARAYEEAGRVSDAVAHYRLAAQLDHNYQRAAEALQRLDPSAGHTKLAEGAHPLTPTAQAGGQSGGTSIPIQMPPPDASGEPKTAADWLG